MICKTCGKEFFQDYRKEKKGVPQYCSYPCSRSRTFDKRSREKKSQAGHDYYKKIGGSPKKGVLKPKDLVGKCKVCGKVLYRAPGKKLRKICSEECRREFFRELAVKRKLGGHTSKVQISYSSPFAGKVYLQSSWEIMCAKLLDALEIPWERPSYLIWKDLENVEHRYYADFYIREKNVYIDTKNDFLRSKDEFKIKMVSEQNKVCIKVIGLENINEQFLSSLEDGS